MLLQDLALRNMWFCCSLLVFVELFLSVDSCVVFHCMETPHLLKQSSECWWARRLSPSLNRDAGSPCTCSFVHWEGSSFAVNSLKWNFSSKIAIFFNGLQTFISFTVLKWDLIGLKWVHSVASTPKIFLANYLGYQVMYSVNFEKV